MGPNMLRPRIQAPMFSNPRAAKSSSTPPSPPPSSVLLLEGPGAEDPLVELETADPKRMVEVLVETGAVAVDRDGERVDAKLGHALSSLLIGRDLRGRHPQ